MSADHYTLGLDIGIDSVGWAVLCNNTEGEPIKVENLGVRIFDKAEQPKTGESLAAPRRSARNDPQVMEMKIWHIKVKQSLNCNL